MRQVLAPFLLTMFKATSEVVERETSLVADFDPKRQNRNQLGKSGNSPRSKGMVRIHETEALPRKSWASTGPISAPSTGPQGTSGPFYGAAGNQRPLPQKVAPLGGGLVHWKTKPVGFFGETRLYQPDLT